MFRRLATILAAVATAVGLLAAPASAHLGRSDSYYLALGDSLAYGYQPSHVTGQGYVDQLYASLHARDRYLKLTNLGCPGETSGTLRTGGICSYPGQTSQLAAAVAFLKAHRGEVSLITIDIGANDVDGCVKSGSLDPTCVLTGLAAIAANLAATVGELRAVAPRVDIVGMNYYDPFLAAWLTGPAGQQLAQQSLGLVGVLNGLPAGVYRTAGFRVADVAGAFSTNDITTMVSGVPLDVSRICQWTWMCTAGDIHANQQGYAVMAKAFETAR
jgi:lysophospholipase L1-like esterase